MDLASAMLFLNRIFSCGGANANDLQVRVRIKKYGTIGAVPSVGVKAISRGIDWDGHTVLIDTDVPLTELTGEQLADLNKVARDKESFKSYEYNKKLKREIDDLKRENAALRSQLAEQKEPVDAVSKSLPPLDVWVPKGTPFTPTLVKKSVKESPYDTKISLFPTKDGKDIT